MKLVYGVEKNSFRKPEHVGVKKKVTSVIDFMRENGIDASLLEYEWVNRELHFDVPNDTDVVYFRRMEPSIKMIRKLKQMRTNNPKIRIIMEIPTYPFVAEELEAVSLKRKVNRNLSEKLLRTVIDRIVLSGQKEKIPTLYKIPVLHIENGVDYEKVNLRKITDSIEKENIKNQEIHLVAVSSCYFWHGYDRLIEGLYEYYQNPVNQRKISFHIVGEGEELQNYITLAKEKSLLDKHVFFYGRQVGEQLDEIYNQCNLAVDCLGCHRKKIDYVSSLKSKEYAAKGLPIITSVNLDVIRPQTQKYILQLPADDNPVQIEEVIKFYDAVYKNGIEDTSRAIRDSFRPFCEWSQVFGSVMHYILN